MRTGRGIKSSSHHLDDHALARDGEGEYVAAAAAHEGVHKARENALRL